MKLYELEELMQHKSLLRVSKSMIVNLMKITSVRPALNGRFSAVLKNGEEIIISRKYVPSLKQILKGGEA
ncbi:MAG: LytTR family transcriptional regulator DNA-binding domain-containing protein, partial [Clostridia bacterium]|nr:LytTR family transcriptional regulator DNA-binding domain-containing protein [Clostridia bacterium]